MQASMPVYADGYVKGKQTKFAGMNHNQGAGDGEIYEMKNLCSDYYPAMATRERRRKYGKLTTPNGLYAAGKLCWVDGTGFYYDGALKGIVTDSRKTFMAINGIIVILPDKKYYDTVKDEFGNLESSYTAADPYFEVKEYQGVPREDPVRTKDYLTAAGTINTPYTQAGNPNIFIGPLVFTTDTVSFNTDKTRLFEDDAIVRIAAPEYTGGKQLHSVRGRSVIQGSPFNQIILTFDANSFTAGTKSMGTISGGITLYPAEFVKDEGDDVGASLFHFQGKQMSEADWAETGIAKGDVVTISDCSIGANNGTYTLKNIVTIGSEAYLKFAKNTFAEGTSEADASYLTKLEINRPTGVGWTIVNQTLQIDSAWEWASMGDTYHFAQDMYVEITGSEHEEYNGYWKITHVASYTMTVAFPNSIGYRAREQEINGDISFQLYEPKTLYFMQTTIDGTTYDAMKIIGKNWLGMTGDIVKISGCSIDENNGYFEVAGRDIMNYYLLFAENTFTQGTDAGYETVLTYRSPGDLMFCDGTLYGEAATLNTIKATDVDWTDYFTVGDAVTISGCEEAANNTTIVIREIEGDEMHFYENSFTAHVDTNRKVTIARVMPWSGDLEGMFESGNRAWTWKDNTIYASKLGDPFNWNVYDGLETDSWAVDVSGFLPFTAGGGYQGYPTFLRDQDVYKVYGAIPSNFELIRVASTGCAPGSGQSLAVAGETMFWLNRNGITAYAGGLPSLIARAFGTERYRNAVAGSDGVKYYVSMEDTDGVWHLFVYDTRNGLWHEEDNTQVIAFAYHEGNLYYLDADGNIMLTGNLAFHPEGATLEPAFDWSVEFTDFTDDSPDIKEVEKLQIRMELEDLSEEEDTASVTVKIMVDSTGEWIIPDGGTVTQHDKKSYIMPIVPRRADHYRIRIEGHGGCRIYSIARQFRKGSEKMSTYSRV